MKWYKHISDSLDDPFIFDLMSEFGADGYLVFFGTLEIYAREFNPIDGWCLRVPRSYLRQKFQKRQETVIIKCLEYIATHGKLESNSCETRIKLPTNSCETPDKLPTNSKKVLINSGKWDVIIEDNYVSVFIPKFKDLIDEWTQRKLGSRSGVTRKILGTDKDKDKDIYNIPPIIPLKGDGAQQDKNKKGAGSPFVKPSLDEVKAYCAERGNIVDPQTWLNHYMSNGWKVGKNKMVDWKAAVRTWEKNGVKRDNRGGVTISV